MMKYSILPPLQNDKIKDAQGQFNIIYNPGPDLKFGLYVFKQFKIAYVFQIHFLMI